MATVEDRKAYNKYHREYRKRTGCERKRRYGVTKDHFEQMVIAQQGACAICEKLTPVLCVDHDHKTNKVRGLLCRKCNDGIGRFCDDPRLFRQAIAYLER